MKIFIALILLLSFTSAKAVEILISDSKILNQNGIRIIPAEVTRDNKIIFEPDAALQKDDEVFLLDSSHENLSHTKLADIQNLPDYPEYPNILGLWNHSSNPKFLYSGNIGQLNIPEGTKNLFVAIGKNINEVVNWYPAQEQKCPANNIAKSISNKSGTQLSDHKLKCYKEQNIFKTFYYSEWSNNVLESECKNYNEASSISEIGTISKGRHKVWNKETRNCEGSHMDNDQSDANTNSTGNFIGAFNIANNKEIWLVFDSSGYENSGYSVVKYTGESFKSAKHIVVNYSGS